MRFNINGNIKNAKYCLIYKENYNNYDEPEFLWNNGLIGDIYSYNKKYNTTMFYWNLNGDWKQEVNKKGETLDDKFFGMISENYRDEEDWYITCLSESPKKLTHNEILSFIATCYSTPEDTLITEDVRSGYRLKLYINNLKRDYEDDLNIEDLNKYFENSKKIKLINYRDKDFYEDDIGSKYVAIKTDNGFILNDFAGLTNNILDKRIYFKMGEIEFPEKLKRKLTIDKINSLKLIYLKRIPNFKNNEDLQFIFKKRLFHIWDYEGVYIEKIEDFEYWINDAYKEKLKYEEKEKINRECRIVESEDYHISYNRIIEDGIDGEFIKTYQFKNNKYELIEEKLKRNPEDKVKIKGLALKYFQDFEIEIDLDTSLNLHDKKYYNLKKIIEDVINTDLVNIKLYQTKNYYNKDKTIETISYFKLDITVLNKEQTVNLFYNIVNEIPEITEDLSLYYKDNGIFIEYNRELKNNEYYNRENRRECTKVSLNDYYRDFIQPWKNSEEYQEIKETIEYKKDYKNYYSIEAPDKPKNKSKVVYFYHYVENKTNNNIIKIGRTNNQSNREVQYRRTGLENQGKTPAYLLNYSYTPLTGDEEVDKWILYCNEDLLKYYCKLLCCESIEDFKEYLSSNKKTNEINNYVVELLSKYVNLDLLSKMEHRKSDFNGKVKLGEEYYQVLGNLTDIKEIIDNFNLLMNNITAKDLLKLRSISELKAYIRKQIVSGELKLKEDEFVEKVENILNNEIVEETM